jgi:hypothetical protein
MPAPRKINDEYRKLIAAVAYLRRMLPSDQQLAYESGCTERGVRSVMERLETNHFTEEAAIAALMTVSRETIGRRLQSHGESDSMR